MSLLECVVEQTVICKVPGCGNTWTLGAQEIVDNWKHNNYQSPKQMCGSCKGMLKELNPLNIQCSTRSCDQTIAIPAFQQLVAEKKGRLIKTHNFFCEKCQQQLKNIKDQKIPCRIKGCSNTWTWFASSQLRHGGEKLDARPDPRLCNSCFQIFQTLSPQKRSCRVHVCDHQWKLDRMTQLELLINGRKEPKRMCSLCNIQLRQLAPKEKRCQVEGCDKTWRWSSFTQIEYERKKERDPALLPPQRYCNSCFSLRKRLKPSQIPCQKNTCPNFVEYPIEHQLQDIVQKKSSSHRQGFCLNCQNFYNELEDKEFICQQGGCDLTWLWSNKEQFEASTYQEGTLVANEPPTHYCERCYGFLHTRSDTYVNCQQCEAPILWTSRQQLMTELKLWVAPRLCPNCLKSS